MEKSNTPQEIESSKNQEFYSLTGIENCPNIKTLEVRKGNLYNQRQLTYTNLLLGGNNLEKVPLFKIEGLEKFHCNALENLKALIINRKYGIEDGNPKKLLTGHIKIHEKLFTITGTLPKLETFRVRYCNTRSLDGLANKAPNLKHLSIDLLHTDSHLSTTLEKFPFLEKLCILFTINEEDNPWFSTVDFDNFRNLKALEITCNTRTLAEDIKQIPNLEALELHDNNLALLLPFKEIASLFPNLKSLIAFKIKPSNMPPLDEIQKLTKLEHFVYITPDRLKGTRKVLKHLKSKEEIEKLCEELALTPTPNLDGAIAINQGVDERQV